MKERIFLSVFFTVFLGLQIYEDFAAIFWQSTSYVLKVCLQTGAVLYFECKRTKQLECEKIVDISRRSDLFEKLQCFILRRKGVKC